MSNNLSPFPPGQEPICPECGEPAESEGMIRRTMMAGSSGYGEDGEYHNHDPNTTKSTLTCSNEHSWEKRSQKSCPASDCDYGGETCFMYNGEKYNKSGEKVEDSVEDTNNEN